jgi:hypothetical protein
LVAIGVHLRANSLFLAADKRESLAAIRDPLVCQPQQRIAAPAHLDGDFP